MTNQTKRTGRWAVVHEVPESVKHDYWLGKPLWLATVYDGNKIIDTQEVESRVAAERWVRESHNLAAVST